MARGTRAHPSDSPLQALEDKKKDKAPRRKAQPLTKVSKASASAQAVSSFAAPSATSQSDEGPESDSAVAPESRSTSPSIKARHNTRSTTRSASRSISPSNVLNHGKRIFNQAKKAATLPRSGKLSKNNTKYTSIGKRTRSQMSIAPEIVPVDDDTETVALSGADNHYEPRANDADDESRPLKRVRQTNITNPSPFSSSTQTHFQSQLTPSIEHVDAPYDHPISSEEDQEDDENEEYVSTGTVVKDEARESIDGSVEDFQSALDKSRRSGADESTLSSPGGSSTPKPLTPKNNSQRAATFAASQNELDRTPTGPAKRLLPPTTAEVVRKSLAEKPLPTDPVERRKEIRDRFDTDIPAPNDKIRRFFASPSNGATAVAEAEDDMDESLSMIAFDVPQTGKRKNIIQENAALKSNLQLQEKQKAYQREQKKLQEEKKKHGEKSAALQNRMESLKSQLHIPATAFCPAEKKLTRVDIIDATHSIVQWTESDPTNPVPSPQQLLDLLEGFKARELAKTANPTANQSSSSTPDTTVIHHRDEAEEHVSHVTKVTQTDDNNDRSSFIMDKGSENPCVSPTGANSQTSASGMSLAVSQPTTPTNRNNTHNQSRLWNTISKVTGVVSSPFKFLAGRNQTAGGPANDTPGSNGITSSQQRGISDPPRLPLTTPISNKKTLRAPRSRANPVPQNRRTKSHVVPHSLSWKRKNLSPQKQKEADARAELLDERYFQEQQKKLNVTQTGERMKKRNAYTAYVEEGDDEDNENPNNVTLKEAGQRVGEKRKRANTPGTFGFSYSDDESSSSDDDSNIEKDPFMHTTKSGITFRIHTDGRRKFATDEEGNQYRVDCWKNPYKHKMKPVTFGGPTLQQGGSAFDISETAPRSKHDSEARRTADGNYWKQLYLVQSDMRKEDREKDNRVRKRSGYNWATDHGLSGGYLGSDLDYWDLMSWVEFGNKRALEVLAEEQSKEHEYYACQRRDEATRRLENEAAAGHSTYKYPSAESSDEEEATSNQPQYMPPSSPRPANAILPAATAAPAAPAAPADQAPTPAELALAKILRHNPKTPTPLSKVWEMSPSYKDDFKENCAPFKPFPPIITAAVKIAPEPEEFE